MLLVAHTQVRCSGASLEMTLLLDSLGHPRGPNHSTHYHSSCVPFRQVRYGLARPFPPASGKRIFLIIAIDYFTKWTEVEPLASITDKQVQAFIWKNIITRIGVPRALVSDNGRQFNNGPTRDYCARFEYT